MPLLATTFPPVNSGWEEGQEEWQAENKGVIATWQISYELEGIDVLTYTLIDDTEVTFIRKK